MDFMVTPLYSAISCLHQRGFLHLDLNRGNIVSVREIVKVIVFSNAELPGPGPKGIGPAA
jgi:tRNA A-37 threonylcarbamoyl transferase component Bud32